MNKKTIIKSLVGVSLFAATMAGTVVQADKASTLKEWTQDAAQSVDSVMTYPEFVSRRGGQGSVRFKVTIDRAGDIVSQERTAVHASSQVKSLARRVLRDVDFPELPSDYEGEQMTFALQLNYAVTTNSFEARNLRRNPLVSGMEVADAGSGGSIAIRILSQND